MTYQIRVRELYSTETIISRLKKMYFLLDVSSASYWTDLNDYHTEKKGKLAQGLFRWVG